MRPDHEPPNPRLARPLRWEWTDHEQHGRVVRLHLPTKQKWSLQNAWTGTIHEALEADATFDQMVAATGRTLGGRLTEPALRDKVGTYLFQLWQQGLVAMDFPAPPAQFRNGLDTIRELGRGGVGVVWLCRDTARDTHVAVKHAWEYFQPLDKTDALIAAEADVLEHVAHPAIIALHDTFVRDGLTHLVRTYIDGAPLAVGPAYDDGTLLGIARETLDILDHLHALGYLLLDLQPANFYHTTDRRVILGDVGNCVPHQGGTTRLKHGTGTPGYSAPEVRRKKRATAAADHYGYGRLLFALLARRPPLGNWGPIEMARHLPDHPLAGLVTDLCAADPEKRPDPSAVRARLDAAVSQ